MILRFVFGFIYLWFFQALCFLFLDASVFFIGFFLFTIWFFLFEFIWFFLFGFIWFFLFGFIWRVRDKAGLVSTGGTLPR